MNITGEAEPRRAKKALPLMAAPCRLGTVTNYYFMDKCFGATQPTLSFKYKFGMLEGSSKFAAHGRVPENRAPLSVLFFFLQDNVRINILFKVKS